MKFTGAKIISIRCITNSGSSGTILLYSSNQPYYKKEINAAVLISEIIPPRQSAALSK